jgi:RNA polymerase sigma-70 factor, ECF subfamily
MFFLEDPIMSAPRQPPHLHVIQGERVGAAEPTDDELMMLVKADHRGAFELLVRRHQQLVLGLAIRYIGDRSIGRDVAQDVFLALWEERHRYEERGRFRSYLVACTVHRCQFVVRQARTRARGQTELLAENPPDSVAVDNEALHTLIEGERRRRVREMLTELPDPMRQVLILRFTHGLPLDQISSLTGLPEGTVKSHLFRGVARLQRLLEKEGS